MQLSLFGGRMPSGHADADDVQRRELPEGAWVDYQPEWLSGHLTLMAELIASASWRQERRLMYERVVDVPRLTAPAPEEGEIGQLIRSLSEMLGQTYKVDLSQVSLAYYRNGQDSVAPHGDRIGARRCDTTIAIVSLGAPRRFTLRRVAGPGNFSYSLGWGDLLVMGGSCQRTWLHGVPKVAHADPRISLVFRPDSPVH